jgi:hypothetical protein
VYQPHALPPQMAEGLLRPPPSNYSLLHLLLVQPLLWILPVSLAELADLAGGDAAAQLEHDAAVVVQHLKQTLLTIPKPKQTLLRILA